LSLSAVETLGTVERPASRVRAGEWVRSHRWPLFATIAGIAVLYASNFEQLFSVWSTDENYSHGFFVPIAFVWMLWRQRRELASTEVSPRSWGIVIVLLALLQLTAGTLGAEYFVAHSSLLVLLCGITLFLFGTKMLRLVAFPIVWLLFMIPLPAIIFYSIMFPMQLLATRLAVSILDLLHVPSVCEGNVIYMANFTAGVVEACSGIRSVISMLAFAVLMGYLLKMSVRSRWILAITAVPIALGMNALRIAATGLAGNYLGARWAEGVFHTFSGLVLFVGCLGLVLGVVAILRRFEHGTRAGRLA
jgi:exosortase